MNRNRMLLGLVGALVVALLASSYVYRQLQRVQVSATVAKQVQVVVAAGPLKLGQPLTASDLALQDWPEGKQPPGSFSRTEDCVGRAVAVPLVAGEVVLDQELAKREAGAGLSVAIPAGMRAVSVGVDNVVAVAGFVTPGTIVDVLVTGTGPGGSLTRTILEHVRVLAVGQELQTENGKPQTAPVVTLLVNPEDGLKLTLASSEGKIHLALRNTVDLADANPPPVYGSTIFFGKAPVAAAPRVVVAKPAPVPAPYTVQVIRGDKVETQSFPR
ncbi:MAG TPA: Flp pilus assembly protein CpaB [Terriglobia bacterium]|nr:Flp pilus assembly protein CpaB [Terriglobia bacterium]